MNKKTIKDIDVKGKKVLCRVDFNVPIIDGKITNDNRIVEAVPTIKYLAEQGAKVVLCSHLGRPEGEWLEEFSMAPVAARLKQLLTGIKVTFVKDVIGETAQAAVAALKGGEVVLLENLRFHKEETKNNEGFCKALAAYADVYVNDAFGTAHRAHASTAGIVQYGFVKTAVAGFLMDKEITYIGGILANPKRPFVAILGGKKVSDKIGVIKNLLKLCDKIIIGGGMAYTFNKALGHKIGKSLLEADKVELARELMAEAKKSGVELLLPIDNKAGKKFSNDTESKVFPSDSIPDEWEGLDIGPKSIALFGKKIKGAKTIIWNGPMGVFEFENFAEGTRSIAKFVAEACGAGAIATVGGGDSVSAITQLGFADKVSHVSTGGGASLEFMEGLELPGVACLENK